MFKDVQAKLRKAGLPAGLNATHEWLAACKAKGVVVATSGFRISGNRLVRDVRYEVTK
jgi:hypothetical protein